MMNEYIADKLRQLEEERLARSLIVKRALSEQGERPKAKPVIGPVIRAAGRTLRRAGEGLEGWASPGGADGEQRLQSERRLG